MAAMPVTAALATNPPKASQLHITDGAILSNRLGGDEMEQEEQEGDRGSIRTAVNLDFIKGRWYFKEEPYFIKNILLFNEL